jgi:hypothetical protein
MIIDYIISVLVVNSLLLLWFFSPFKTSLGKIIFKKDLTVDQFDDIIFIKNKVFGQLTSCWICCSFWLSLIVGIVWVAFFSFPCYWPFLLFFTIPCLSYIFYTYIK